MSSDQDQEVEEVSSLLVDADSLFSKSVEHFEIKCNTKKKSFAWASFGILIYNDKSKKIPLLTDKIFCNQCLKAAKEEDSGTPFVRFTIKSYKNSISTGNLIKHLADDHKLREPSKRIKSEKNLLLYFNKKPRPAATAVATEGTSKKWLLGRDLALLICRDLLPFSLIENEGFLDFSLKYNVIRSPDELPSRTTISRTALDDVYLAMKQFTISLVQKNSVTTNQGAITFDLWTDNYRHRSYICFSLHLIDAKFKLLSISLGTKLVVESHTAENIVHHLESILEEFELQNLRFKVVTDAGANCVKAARISDIENHLCLGHGLHNSIIVDGIKNNRTLNNFIGKVREIVKCLRYKFSSFEKEVTIEQQKILLNIDNVTDVLDIDDNNPCNLEHHESNDSEGEDEVFTTNANSTISSSNSTKVYNRIKTLKLDVPTRWHSILIMLQSISSNKIALNNLLDKIGKNYLQLTNSEWELNNHLIKFLEKFQEVVKLLSAQKGVTMNLTMLLRSELCSILLDNEKDIPVIKKLKQDIYFNFDKRFPITDTTVAAALLDPRFQQLDNVNKFLENSHISAVEFLKRIVAKSKYTSNVDETNINTVTVNNNSSNNNNPSSISELINKHSIQSTAQNNFEKECNLLFSSHHSSCYNNVLEFWEKKQEEMPIMAHLARQILCIPATSTPSERIFSIDGLILSNKRSSISPNNLDKVLFIHDNYQLCKSIFED